MKLNQRKNIFSKNMRMVSSHLAGVLILFITLWAIGGTPVYGVPPATPQEQQEARNLIYQSAQATEEAWEEFHQAAIEGTLASPAIQSNIEQQLHEARALLMEARKAERANQYDSVQSLTQKILQITQNIVQASRERKK